MSVALLFPGQGTQHATMLTWLDADPAARPILGRLDTLLGRHWRTGLEDVAWARTNRVAQLVLTGASLAVWASLEGRLSDIAVVAGYSVGEVASCVAAGMLDPMSALCFASWRAMAMDGCDAGFPTGLMAISGIDAAGLAKVCERWRLDVAIRIGPERCIVGGTVDALDASSRDLAAIGAQATVLGIRVASHTPAMGRAVPVLKEELASLDWVKPAVPWVSGSRAAVLRDPGDVRDALAEQVAMTIRWDECMDTVAERRPDCVLEVGPGDTLSRMWRERHPDIPARSCEDFSGASGICRWVAGQSGH